MARRHRKRNRGGKKHPPGGDQGPRRAVDDHGPRRAAVLDEDHDMGITLTPPTPRYLAPNPQSRRPRRQPPRPDPPPTFTTLTPPPDNINTNRHNHPHNHPDTPPPNSPNHLPQPPPDPPYPPRCPTCNTTSCPHHHSAHASLCTQCDFIRRQNYELRDALTLHLSRCATAVARWADDALTLHISRCCAAVARWADDVNVGNGTSMDMMEWQPEGTTLVHVVECLREGGGGAGREAVNAPPTPPLHKEMLLWGRPEALPAMMPPQVKEGDGGGNGGGGGGVPQGVGYEMGGGPPTVQDGRYGGSPGSGSNVWEYRD